MKFTVIDNFLPLEVVARINAEWPSDADWTKKACPTSIKWSTSNLPPYTADLVKRMTKLPDGYLVKIAEQYTAIEDLIPDNELFGAGLHCIPQGGFLNMHVDFNKHPKGWHRRVNMLIYLNEDWKPEWGGQLQLGCDNPIMIDPVWNRCVIFETTEDSWHGHPEPLKCPTDRQRRSLALYFYTKEPPPTAAHSTIYR
jgi:hypothetical protein